MSAIRCHDVPRGSRLIVSPRINALQSRDSVTGSQADDLQRLAAADPLQFLKMCQRHYDETITDYRCVFILQERLNGRLGPEQEMEVMFRQSPFSVNMHWLRNPALAKRANYVAGRWKDAQGNELALFQPAGVIGLLIPSMKRDIHGPVARRSSRRPMDQFGFKNTLDLIIYYCIKAQGNDRYDLRYAGVGQVDDRPTFVFKRFLPYTGPEGEYPDRLAVFHIDQEMLVPISTTAYADVSGDDDATTASTGRRLLGRYIFTRVEYNVGLTDADFERAAGLAITRK